MKKYNSFKLTEINSDDYSVKQEIDVKVEDGYIVGKISSVINPFALSGSIVEDSKTEEEDKKEDNNKGTAEDNKTINPQTGDYICIAVAVLVFASVAFVLLKKKIRNK